MSASTIRRSIVAAETLGTYTNISSTRYTSQFPNFNRHLIATPRPFTLRIGGGRIGARFLSQTTQYRQTTPSRASSAAAKASPSPSPSSPPPPPPAVRAEAATTQPATANSQTTDNLYKSGLSDKPPNLLETNGDSAGVNGDRVDWTRSFHGISAEPFPKEVADILLEAADPADVEIKPDGIIYLPEIKYRRILNRAFGPGGWGLVPRGESIVTPKTVTREYALVCHGR
jgi:hypothetical protein